LVAVDTTARVPLADPAAAGANVTVNVTRSFAASVIGIFRPLTEKPVPLTVASEIVTAVAPVLVSVSVRLDLLVFVTLPNERDGDEAASAALPVLLG
jgi:hypothetical protein